MSDPVFTKEIKAYLDRLNEDLEEWKDENAADEKAALEYDLAQSVKTMPYNKPWGHVKP
jgi:hypothetical protein